MVERERKKVVREEKLTKGGKKWRMEGNKNKSAGKTKGGRE